jgi:phosphonate transport system substrate-binding protein
VGPLTFAAALRSNEPIWRTAFEEVCALLSEDVGAHVTPLLAHAPSTLAEALAQGRADFAWISPTLLLMASGLEGVVPLVSSVRQGVATFHSVVFTAPSSRFATAKDLRDARAAWVAPTSASGYLVGRLALARLGVDLDAAIAADAFVDSHGGVVRAVLGGEADLGATYAHCDAAGKLLRAGYHDEGGDARVLAIGGPIPADMIVARPGLELGARVRFAGALCRLAHDPVGSKPLRATIGADDFCAVSHQMLAELDGLMKASR